MKDLFDMIAGTSIGSIIAGSLVMPANTTINGKVEYSKHVPALWADDMLDMFNNRIDSILEARRYSPELILLFNAITIPVFVYFGYYYGWKAFSNNEKIK